MKRNIRLTIEYDGSRYQGWQRLGGDSNANTIQGKLESVLSKMTGEDVNINGSGRTDAGVHAYGQVANFHTDCMMSVNEIKTILPNIFHLISVLWKFLKLPNVSQSFKCERENLSLPDCNSWCIECFERKYLWYFPETLDIKRWKKLHHY